MTSEASSFLHLKSSLCVCWVCVCTPKSNTHTQQTWQKSDLITKEREAQRESVGFPDEEHSTEGVDEDADVSGFPGASVRWLSAAYILIPSCWLS